MVTLRKAAATLALSLGLFAGAHAITLWSSSTGDVNLPGLTPTAIDNMPIGATTPSTGAFTTLGATGAVSGAGFTARFASPGPIGSTTPSTGNFSTLQVNSNANLMCGTYFFTGTPAATNQVFYIATRPLLVTSISEVHSVAAGGTSTLDITKDSTTAAPAGGTALTSAAFNLNATANTVQAGALAASVPTLTMAAGDRIAVKFNNAIQASAGVVVTACMSPI
jgi:hypothetical protein